MHIDVGGPGDSPADGVRDVIGGEGLTHARVDGGGPVGVTPVPVERKLVGAYHAGRDLDHPHRLARQFQPQRRRDRVFAMLGGDVLPPPPS